ncbi:N-6 DNA Methylase [Candidatus Mycoplasma haematohominis]|uniref:site-specific DNA-methyltransferase (adenine-specific) n=1 Tax=Candidatus Mycoplasma haematohominis TaxID=1494318 RepID=A0A478FSZ6_9MOLU|nr:N-6 DNA Methylase [Candidatus Mycoplasma haemohominis]
MSFEKEKNRLYKPLINKASERFLFLILYKFMSEESINYIDENLKEKGFYIYPEDRFRNVLQRYEKNSDGLSIYLKEVVRKIENHAIDKYKELFRNFNLFDFKNKDQELKLNEKIIKDMQDLNSNYEAKFNFAEAYEYLVAYYSHFEQIPYCPEVSELSSRLALLKNSEIQTVCDPLCDFGSTLLEFQKIWKQFNPNRELKMFGRTSSPSAYKHCLGNMLLNKINHDNLSIDLGILNPIEKTKFDVIVANLYRSLRKEDEISFFKYCMNNLSEDGVAVITYLRDISLEARKYLVKNNYVECVMQFVYWPNQLSGGVRDLIILRKNKKSNQTLFINAKSSGEYIKNEMLMDLRSAHKISLQKKLVLTEKIINRLIEIYTQNKNISGVAKLVDNSKIIRKNYRLSVLHYVSIAYSYPCWYSNL